MSDPKPPTITASAVERALDPTTGLHKVRVRFTIEEPGGLESEWSIWIPREASFAKAEELALKELHRISSRIAETAGLAGGATPAAGSETKQAGRRRPQQPEPKTSEWAR